MYSVNRVVTCCLFSAPLFRNIYVPCQQGKQRECRAGDPLSPSSACGERGAGESRLISARREASALPCVRRSAEAPSPRGANLQSASSRARREHSTESEPAGSTTANGRTKDVRSRGTGEVEPRGDMMTRKGNNKTSANDDPTRKAEGGPDRPIQGAQTTRPATPRHGV